MCACECEFMSVHVCVCVCVCKLKLYKLVLSLFLTNQAILKSQTDTIADFQKSDFGKPSSRDYVNEPRHSRIFPY